METRKIKERLRSSLEMAVTWQRLLLISLVVVPVVVFNAFCWRRPLDAAFWMVTALAVGITILPMLVFCIWRTFQIFRKPEAYIFCRARLAQPHGGPLRDTMFFTVVLEDPEDGGKFFADTHAIFYTHGLIGPTIEDYTNKTVTIAYNRETEMVVVIG